MKIRILETFGYFEPGPDEHSSGPYVEHREGQVLADVPDDQAKAWIGKGHAADATPTAEIEPPVSAPAQE